MYFWICKTQFESDSDGGEKVDAVSPSHIVSPQGGVRVRNMHGGIVKKILIFIFSLDANTILRSE